ncbi:DMT family transporter [Vibrio algarum]|uniref:DMT family transporter n=1 Tax=Vibrio algarum TaxID=3020714 RepID=A0ABT4YV14_9VIBR|nr:DMT family transporter [Vibrio sp. KJ40-1]MDB1125411.1 DMT family transporter [Vibrio sp. KJ40-1]
MTLRNMLQLLLLAALWGGSFLFMRVSANALGPAVLIEARVTLAALFLLLVSLFLKRKLPLLKYKRHFLIIGLFNTALPFLFFAYAAQTLNASTLSILNSTAAIWGAVISVFWTKTALTRQASFGLVIGVIGVVILVGWDAASLGSESILPITAGILAAVCYGIASNYTRTAPQISSFDNAHGNMWAAALIVLPLVFFIPIREVPTIEISLSVIALGVFSTGVAYLLYFNLVANVGAASALSVTFLIPVFGILWGYLILDEQIGWNTLFGTLLVLSGTMLVTGFSLRSFVNSKLRVECSR